jgi:hypothetical protein
MAAFAQGTSGANPPPPSSSLFATSRPDAVLVVYKGRTGADLVQVSILDPHFPPALLRQEIARMGQELKSEPRGVDVGYTRSVPSDPDSTVLRGNFAVDGLIDRVAGTLHIRAIARGFALASGRAKLDALMIQFQHESPTASTLRSCAPPEAGCSGAIIEGRAQGADVGIEYRLKYLTHDPDQIDLPDSPREVSVKKPIAHSSKPSTDWTLVILVIVGGAAAGALVYSLLLGRRRRTTPRPGSPRPRRYRFCSHFACLIV